MFDIEKVLVEICGDESVLEDGIDLIEEGYLDSYGIIELFSKFEDEGLEISPTEIKKDDLRNLKKLKELLKKYY